MAEAASICSNPAAIPRIHSSIRASLRSRLREPARRASPRRLAGVRGRHRVRPRRRASARGRRGAEHDARRRPAAGRWPSGRAWREASTRAAAARSAPPPRPSIPMCRAAAERPRSKISDEPCRAQHQGAFERRACQNRPRRCSPVQHFTSPLSWLFRSFPTCGPALRASGRWRPHPAAPLQSVPAIR